MPEIEIDLALPAVNRPAQGVAVDPQRATDAINLYLNYLTRQGVIDAATNPGFSPNDYQQYITPGSDPLEGIKRFLSDKSILDYDRAPTYEEPDSQESILAVARYIPRRIAAEGGIGFQFDQDGVLTKTPHEECWKVVFDRLFQQHNKPEFSSEEYHTIISGRNRFEAIYDYLVQRGILEDTVKERTPANLEKIPLVFQIADDKNRLVRARLMQEPIVRIESMIALLVEAHEKYGIPTAVVSASKSTNLATGRAGIAQYIDVALEGRVTEMHGKKGKPEPFVYAHGASQLGVLPERTVVFEDAPKGVQAASRAGAGLVVGYADEAVAAELRKFNTDLREQLEEAGAHIIVSDIRRELPIRRILQILGE